MRIIKAKDYADMSKKAADIIAAQIIMKPDCVLGLATGSTPEGMYAELVKKYEAGEIDFARVHSVNLDEYKGLPRDNDQSYYYFMNHHLFSHVNIDPANTNLPDGTIEDTEEACARYNSILAGFGGADIQLLGIGHNGHIGFNEPGDTFELETHCVDLQESTIKANQRFFASYEDVPKQAYTMGIKNIMDAKMVLMVVNGEAKADAVKKSFFGPVTPQVPASILQLHKNFVLVADEAALSKVEL